MAADRKRPNLQTGATRRHSLHPKVGCWMHFLLNSQRPSNRSLHLLRLRRRDRVSRTRITRRDADVSNADATRLSIGEKIVMGCCGHENRSTLKGGGVLLGEGCVHALQAVPSLKRFFLPRQFDEPLLPLGSGAKLYNSRSEERRVGKECRS